MGSKVDAWHSMQGAFPVLCDAYSLPFVNITEVQLEEIAQNLNESKLTETIQNLVINRIEKHVREIVVPQFWQFFKHEQAEVDNYKNFYCAVELLYEYYIQFRVLARNIDQLRKKLNFHKIIYHKQTAEEALKSIFNAILMSQMPLNYNETIHSFYEIALRLEDKGRALNNSNCKICIQDSCLCQQSFNETNQKLVELELNEPLIGQVLTDLIYNYIEDHVQKTCKDVFDISFITGNDEHSLETWLSSVIVVWLQKIHISSDPDIVSRLILKLNSFLYDSYTMIRISQLFKIIIEYPESVPALQDINLCLAKTDLRPLLTKKLREAMETRLLHPGVSTPDILTAYVAAIRSMRVLDPSGALLESITRPVHQYLRSRPDTVRCVVSSFIEEGPNDLSEELVHSETTPNGEDVNTNEESYEDWQTWTPDPVEIDNSKSIMTRRCSDIISMLINVYGSKELFISEYRTLLADRLLSQLTCDTEKEIRYLELMKLRFGDTQLNSCEVMMKDIADSKRISQHIKQDVEYIEVDVPMNAIILSKQFWPVFKDEKLELHERITEQLKRFTKGFETLKGNRTLSWMTHLGLVDIDIELPDRHLTLSVTPVHATIIMHFQDKSTWKLDELSHVMQIPATTLRKKLSFWQSRSLISEAQTDVFQLTEHETQTNTTSKYSNSCDIVLEEEAESAMASSQDQREEELQTMWSYINGMLMNLDSMSLERIHQMLKMFAFEGPTIDCNINELQLFLDRKVREHQLVYSGGLYRLPKS